MLRRPRAPGAIAGIGHLEQRDRQLHRQALRGQLLDGRKPTFGLVVPFSSSAALRWMASSVSRSGMRRRGRQQLYPLPGRQSTLLADSMGRRGWGAEFRQWVLDLVAAGRRVGDVAATSTSAIRRCIAGDARSVYRPGAMVRRQHAIAVIRLHETPARISLQDPRVGSV